jgi:hypothetical protein
MSDVFRRTAWAMALASTLFIAACGDDDNDNTNNPSPVTSPSPTQSASPSPSPSDNNNGNNGNNNGNNQGQVVSFVGIARQVDQASGTLRVGGRRVDVNSNTQIQNMSGSTIQLSQLQGQTVRVRGRDAGDGSVVAERITLQDQNTNDDNNNNGNNNNNS